MTSIVDRVSLAILRKGVAGLMSYGIYESGSSTSGMFYNILPDSPTTSIALFNRGGFGRAQLEESVRYSNLSLQFTIRSESSQKGLEICEIVINNVHGFTGFVDSIHILDCQAEQGEPVPLGQDDSGRHEYTINFAVTYSLQ